VDLLLDAFLAVSRELTRAKLVIRGHDDGFLSTLQKKIAECG
jgi:hypothetical protein